MARHERHDELLASQLLTVLDELAAKTGDPIEVAVLAGLLERYRHASPALDAADDWVEGPGAEVLSERLKVIELEPLVDHLLETEHDEDEHVDALFALDEACAALTFAGMQARAWPAIEECVQTILALPERWSRLSSLASRVLEEAAPLGGDPALALWRATEASGAYVPHRAGPLPSVAGAVPVLPRKEYAAEASGPLGRRPDALNVPLGPRAFLTAHQADDARLFVDAAEDAGVCEITAECDGQPVRLERLRPTTWLCPYRPGTYVFRVDGVPWVVEVR